MKPAVFALGIALGFVVAVYALGKHGERACDWLEERWRFV